MRTRWIRNEPGRKENALALGVALGAALGVATLVFYLARLFLARDEIEPLEVARRGDGRGQGARRRARSGDGPGQGTLLRGVPRAPARERE